MESMVVLIFDNKSNDKFLKHFFSSSLTWSQNLLPKVTTDTDGNINKVEYYRVIGNKII